MVLKTHCTLAPVYELTSIVALEIIIEANMSQLKFISGVELFPAAE
jgi:hypothetical protein